MEESNFLVRVSCMTYNQASFIEDAMSGFCMQETTFPFICVIIDDASTDGEQEVIRHFVADNFSFQNPAQSYDNDTDYGHVSFAPHKTNKNCFFVVIYLNENHYQAKKSKYPYFKEWYRTKYVALCEGDDYWIDPMKLQKQVGFLENHEDYGFVGTNIMVDKGGTLQKERPVFSSGVVEDDFLLVGDVFEDAIGGPVTRTVSLLYKRELIRPYAKYVKGDMLLESILAKQSKYACYQGYASVYRKGVGVSSSQNDLNRALRYNDYIVKSRRLQNQLFPDYCNWQTDELEDRGTYLLLIYAIRKMKWKEAISHKESLKSDMYRNKTYSRFLYGPISCVFLNIALKIKHHE